MNLLLLKTIEAEQRFAPLSREHIHVRDILKMREGAELDVGLAGGPLGRARVVKLDSEGLRITVRWLEKPEAVLSPVRVLAVLGLARPQTARKQLQVLATLGVSHILFCETERGEKGYRQSSLWTDGEWERHVWAGVEQAFATDVPAVEVLSSLEEALRRCEFLTAEGTCQGVALDNYEATMPLSAFVWRGGNTRAFAIGSERGWSAGERDQLRQCGWPLVHLGARVLRCETAATLAAAVCLELC